MIDWGRVDLAMVVWSVANAVLAVIGIGCFVWLVRARRRGRLDKARDAIARYESRKSARGAMSALFDKH